MNIGVFLSTLGFRVYLFRGKTDKSGNILRNVSTLRAVSYSELWLNRW